MEKGMGERHGTSSNRTSASRPTSIETYQNTRTAEMQYYYLYYIVYMMILSVLNFFKKHYMGFEIRNILIFF